MAVSSMADRSMPAGTQVMVPEPEPENPPLPPRRWPAGAITAVLRKPSARAGVVLVWLCLAIGGLAVAKPFAAALVSSCPPVPGSASYEAHAALQRYFPEESLSKAFLLNSVSGAPFMELQPRSTCALNMTLSFPNLRITCRNESALGKGCIRTQDLISQIQDTYSLSAAMVDKHMASMLASLPASSKVTHCPVAVDEKLSKKWSNFATSVQTTLESRYPNCVHNILSQESIHAQTVNKKVSILNVSLEIPGGNFWNLFKNQLMANANHASLVSATTSACDGIPVDPLGQQAIDISKDMERLVARAPEAVRAHLISERHVNAAINEGMMKTFDFSGLMLPVALLILAAMLRNIRLVLCTLVNILACSTSTIFIMYPVALQTTVSATAPSLIIAVALAMSIDYSLFLLTRYQKEISDGRTNEEAVEIMLSTSGKMVLVSGLTLLMCFLTMWCLPASFIAILGVSSAITVCMASLAALSLTPMMLLSWPTFFGNDRRRGQSEEIEKNQSLEVDWLFGELFWQRFGQEIIKYAIPALLVLIAVAVPFAVHGVSRFAKRAGPLPLLPSNSDVTQALMAVQDAFGDAATFPTNLLVVPPRTLVDTDNKRNLWLNQACKALTLIAAQVNASRDPAAPEFKVSDFMGVMILNGACMQGIGTWSNFDGPYSATKVGITYPVDPFSKEGRKWITSLRDAVVHHSDIGSWHITGAGATMMDVSRITFRSFPLMIVLMTATVLLVIGLSFRSVVAPVRAVLSLSWMITVTFGLAVFIYKDGCLDFLNMSQLGHRASGSMSWLTPFSIPVVVGLGLDYDIFYSETVLEERECGHTEEEAAVRALASTANTISAAGMIMVFTFMPLLLGTTPCLNETGLILIVGVVIDCFITTKVIIPATISLLGRYNFWPRKMCACKEESPITLHEKLTRADARMLAEQR
jgi:hypothetical protein